MKNTDIAIILTGVGTIILAGAVIYQTSILQEEFESNNRPWISIAKIDRLEGNKIVITYQNFGKIPNKEGKMGVTWADALFTKDLMYKETPLVLNLGIVLPNQQQYSTVLEAENVNEAIAKSGGDMYVGILLRYNYLNDKEGEFGSIVLYDKKSSQFIIQEDWIK